MATANVSVTGLDEVNRLFRRIVKMSGDPQEILDQGSTIMLNRIRGRFLDTKNPDGTTWPESEASKRRKKSGRDGKTLFNTGKLFHSIQPRKPSKYSRSIYTDKPYASYHNEGVGQVKRIFLGFSEGDVNVLLLLVKRRLEELS